MKKLKVFLSYSWSDKNIADTVDNDFSRVGIKLIRDIRDLKYQESISEFIPTKKDADYSICIVSDTFVKSLNCMWEMMDLWKKELFEQQICPIITDSLVLDDDSIVDYTKYWQEKNEHINSKINSINNLSKMGFKETIEKHAWISSYISQFLYYLKDKNYITYAKIKEEGLRAYSTTIFDRIGLQTNDNIEILCQLSEQNDVIEFELQADRYLSESLVSPTELFMFTRASFYEKKGYYDLAIYHYKNAIRINEKFVPALEALVKLYITGEGRDKIDIDELLKLLDFIEDEKSFVAKARGMLSFEQSPKNALVFFEESKVTNPINEYIYNNIGCCLESIGDYDSAIKNYQKAISINSQYYQAYNNLAIICIKTRNLNLAQNSIEECLNIKPDYAYGLETKGLLLEEDGNYTEAISYYLRALTYKIWAGPFSNIGRIYEYEFDLPKLSREYYEQAYYLDDKSFSTNYNLGNYYRKYMNDILCATRLLKEANSIDPNNALCSLSLGILYWSLKEYHKARDYFAFSFICEKSSVGCFWLCCALIEDNQYENVKKILNKFRNNQNNLLIDFLHIYLCKNGNDEKNCTDCDLIINFWKDDETYKKYLQNIEYGEDLLLKLQKISDKYLSLSKDHIYKDSKLIPIINLKDSYQYIKDNFYELI